jgi:hypothetical protein
MVNIQFASVLNNLLSIGKASPRRFQVSDNPRRSSESRLDFWQVEKDQLRILPSQDIEFRFIGNAPLVALRQGHAIDGQFARDSEKVSLAAGLALVNHLLTGGQIRDANLRLLVDPQRVARQQSPPPLRRLGSIV